MKKLLMIVLVVVAAFALEAKAAAAEANRVLFVLAEGFNRSEHWDPYVILQAVGYEIDIAGVSTGVVRLKPDKESPKWDAQANLTLADASVDRYRGLVIPGGYSPGNLEKHPEALKICKDFFEADKPVAAICHGPRLLMRAGLLEDRVATCWFGVANELADSWKQGDAGTFVDQAVVIDGQLVTSRAPFDNVPFIRATLQHLEAAGGIPVADHPMRALVLTSGLDGHDRYVLRDLVKSLNIKVRMVYRPGDVAKVLEDESFDITSYDAVLVAGDKSAAGFFEAEHAAKLMAAWQATGRPTVASKDVQAELPDSVSVDKVTWVSNERVALVKKLYHAAIEGYESREVQPKQAAQPNAVVRVESGFDDHAFSAIDAMLRIQGHDVEVVSSSDRGWVTGKQGLTLHTVSSDGIDGVPVYRVTAEGVTGGEASVIKALAPAEKTAAGEYDAAIVLREGFDGRVAAGMHAYLTAVKGKKTAIIAHTKGTVKGAHGMAFEADATYADDIKLSKDALLIAPGGLWPEFDPKARHVEVAGWIEEQHARDEARKAWILGRYQDGATLMTFGFDSRHLGRDEMFKGKKFAGSDQVMWSMGKTGAKYTGGAAVVSGPKLISAKGAESIGDAVRLLDEAAQASSKEAK